MKTQSINIGKYKSNPVAGQEQFQNNLVRIWRDVHNQAGTVIENLQSESEEA